MYFLLVNLLLHITPPFSVHFSQLVLCFSPLSCRRLSLLYLVTKIYVFYWKLVLFTLLIEIPYLLLFELYELFQSSWKRCGNTILFGRYFDLGSVDITHQLVSCDHYQFHYYFPLNYDLWGVWLRSHKELPTAPFCRLQAYLSHPL